MNAPVLRCPLHLPPWQALLAGHDHNLQVMHKPGTGYVQVTSGAGSRLSSSEFQGTEDSLFQAAVNGALLAAAGLLCGVRSFMQDESGTRWGRAGLERASWFVPLPPGWQQPHVAVRRLRSLADPQAL